jgi:GT2 family glycosyltransferase
VVATELLGFVDGRGFAPATTNLAFALAADGTRVTVLHCGDHWILEPGWAQRYAAAGVEVRQLQRSRIVDPDYLADSYRICRDTRAQGFDAIVFPDRGGSAFCSVHAKAQGLAFSTTTLAVLCRSPSAWVRAADEDPTFGVADVARDHMERRSAELSDVVVATSEHVVAWMRAAGWRLPATTRIRDLTTGGVRQLGSPGTGPGLERSTMARDPRAPLGLAFVGDLDDAGAVHRFVAALNQLGPTRLAGRRITFVGEGADRVRAHVEGDLDGAVRAALAELSFASPDGPSATATLRGRPDVVAVICARPDLAAAAVAECLDDGVAFVAPDVEATRELVAPEDRSRVLAPAGARELAARLDDLLAKGRVDALSSAESAGAARVSLDAWRRVLAPPAVSTAPTAPAVAVREPPLVSVVVPHHDRPELVRHCLEGVLAQDHAPLEVVVVDDGSTDPAAHAALAELERGTWALPLRVVRQPNRYMGAARNAGVRAARGELVAFLDDDNVPGRTFVSTLVDAIEHTGADAATCYLQMFRTEHGPPRLGDEAGVWCFLGPAVELGMIENVFGDVSGLYRRRVLEDLGGFHEQHGVGFEDWDLLARLVLSGRSLVVVPEPLVWYRVSPGSVMRTTSPWRNMRPVLAAYERLLPPSLRPIPELLHALQTAVADGAEEDERLRDERAALPRHVPPRPRPAPGRVDLVDPVAAVTLRIEDDRPDAGDWER